MFSFVKKKVDCWKKFFFVKKVLWWKNNCVTNVPNVTTVSTISTVNTVTTVAYVTTVNTFSSVDKQVFKVSSSSNFFTNSRDGLTDRPMTRLPKLLWASKNSCGLNFLCIVATFCTHLKIQWSPLCIWFNFVIAFFFFFLWTFFTRTKLYIWK